MKTTMAIKGLILVSALSLSGVVGAQEAASPEPASSELDAVVVKDDQDLQNRTTVRAERVEQTQAEDIKESLKGVSDVMVGGRAEKRSKSLCPRCRGHSIKHHRRWRSSKWLSVPSSGPLECGYGAAKEN